MSILFMLASPAATILAAGAAVFVTWRIGRGQLDIAQQQAKTANLQAELANVRLQHDLYDRRYALYKVAQALLIEINTEAAIELPSIIEFNRGTLDAVFLLNVEMVSYFDEIKRNAIQLRNIKIMVKQPEYAAKHSDSVDEEARLITWFNEQVLGLIEKFKPFLVLDKRTA